jgi:hypothetical protein
LFCAFGKVGDIGGLKASKQLMLEDLCAPNLGGGHKISREYIYLVVDFLSFIYNFLPLFNVLLCHNYELKKYLVLKKICS